MSNRRWRVRWALMVSVSLAACTPAPTHNAAGQPMAPPIVGKSVAGEYLALSDHRGDVVLVNIWATWCAPCREELPELARLHREYLGRGFTVFAVSTDKHGRGDAVAAMSSEFALPYPIVLDPDGRWSRELSAPSLPTSVLVGRDGAIVWRRRGVIQPEDPELAAALEPALAAPRP